MASPVVTGSLQEANESVPVKADRADEMLPLSIGDLGLKSENDIILSRMEYLVTGLFRLELVKSPKFLAKRSKTFAQLNVHDVGRSQLCRQCVYQLPCFSALTRIAGVKQRFNRLNRSRRLTGKAHCAGSKPHHFIDLRQIHRAESPVAVLSADNLVGMPLYPQGTEGGIQRLCAFEGDRRGEHFARDTEFNFFRK
ncbi:hypothetical protein GV68_15075 [Pseudorhizobium pelagicum]|uniref:Uncharacterized protein n=1 Tax=Pseudorhizobium pelagicum TaxID=1509405 RepID=A0A922P645_9HYPH|nr:hypothetical protein GV68_15075 [Pseudorhizobium pelagicum]